jgi:NADPH-dependent dioxygenase
VGNAAASVAAELSAGAADWLSVRSLVDSAGTPDTARGDAGHRPLPDPSGRVRVDLGVGPRGWLLVRPDGYLAARGDDFSVGAVTASIPGVGTARSASTVV